MCLDSVRKNGMMVKFVDGTKMKQEDYEEICMEAVKQNGKSIEEINRKLVQKNFGKIFLEAIKTTSSINFRD